jgi:alpha-L-fucosidase
MPDAFYEYCEQLAQWMAHSRDSVIGAGPAPGENHANVPITTRSGTWYLHVLPSHQGPVVLHEAPEPKSVTLLRTGKPLSSKRKADGLAITIPSHLRTDMDDVIAVRF